MPIGQKRISLEIGEVGLTHWAPISKDYGHKENIVVAKLVS